MTVNHGRGLCHTLAMIEGHEKKMAWGSKACSEPDRIDGFIEDVIGDVVEQVLVARRQPADFNRWHRASSPFLRKGVTKL
nr:hypothetical protein [Aminobacter sp. AP02]